MKTLKCRRCGETAGYLMRVNEKGVPGVWECRPVCGADLPQETLLMMAITDEAEPAQSQEERNE